jgi:RND family efflux transporter MFP subunit
MIRLWTSICFAIFLSSTTLGQQMDGFTEPISTLRIATVESGRISKVHVKRGDIVAVGDVLIQLDSEILEIEEKIAKAEAADRTTIEKLETELRAKLEQNLEINKLLKQGAVSPEEFRQSELDISINEMALKSAQNVHHRAELRYEEATKRRQRRTIRSPVDAIVVDVVPQPGEFVAMSQPHVVTLVQLHKLRVTFFLPTETAIKFQSGDRIGVRRMGVAKIIAAEIEYVAEITQANSGRVRMDVLIDNSDRSIRSGMKVTLDVTKALAQLQSLRQLR